jgi:hypothetical protein
MGRRILVIGGLVVLALVVWVYNGIFIGSGHAQRTWYEPSKKEIHGQVLVCRYFKLRGGIHEEDFWPASAGPDVFIPDGAGTAVAVSASHIGVARCPWTEAWIGISPQ